MSCYATHTTFNSFSVISIDSYSNCSKECAFNLIMCTTSNERCSRLNSTCFCGPITLTYDLYNDNFLTLWTLLISILYRLVPVAFTHNHQGYGRLSASELTIWHNTSYPFSKNLLSTKNKTFFGVCCIANWKGKCRNVVVLGGIEII